MTDLQKCRYSDMQAIEGTGLKPSAAHVEHRGGAQSGLASALRRFSEALDNVSREFSDLSRSCAKELDDVGSSRLMVPVPHEFPSQLLSVSAVADRLSVDAKTIRRWRSEKRLPPAVGIGGVIRWRSEAIEEWILSMEEQR